MHKVIVTLGCIMALLVLVEARPPKGMRMKKFCAGNSTCEVAARNCGRRMKDAYSFMKGEKEPNFYSDSVEQCIQGLGIDLPERSEGGRYDKGFWRSLDEGKMVELKKCMMEKMGVIDASGLLIRSPFKESVQIAFAGDNNLLTAMLSAVDTCPEPQDGKMMDFFKCMGEACINNITI